MSAEEHNAGSLRFAILHHQVKGGEHWDFLLEHEGKLLSWQLFHYPLSSGNYPITCRRLADHRLMYLDYEGPVSRDRGHVRRVDSGHFQFEKLDEDHIVVQLSGYHLSGMYELLRAKANGELWAFQVARPKHGLPHVDS